MMDKDDLESLRDYFAGQALAGYLANMDVVVAAHRIAVKEGQSTTDSIAIAAYEYADAMMTARQKTGGPHESQ
jgi:hypothetical protein